MNLKVTVTIDRPIGYVHHEKIYPVNYGYVSGVIGGDGCEQDAYVIDSKIDFSIDRYEGNIIAVIERYDDVETKWIVSNESFSAEEIYEKVKFMEHFFDR